MVCQEAQRSRGDGSEVLFGDAVAQRGLDGAPSVAGGHWWVVRVAVDGSDEFLGVVAWPSRGVEDEWDQVDAGISFEPSLFGAIRHVA